MGREDAWEHFVQTFRPAMYRAADAIDPQGGAREIAESLYAELFGLREKDGIRQSVFRYFHGRSSLSTWLRSLISQRFVDRHRETRRLAPLPDETAVALPASSTAVDPNRARYVTAMRAALAASIAALDPRDRLRLACYYAQEMTLAAIGKLTREHEATVSRQLSRTRQAIREDVVRRLREEHGFPAVAIDECFASIVNDAGDLDLAQWLDGGSPAEALAKAGRKKHGLDRSKGEDPS
jgi:RNA polymerase sigma-70 factor (ECF subfamily)